MTEETRYPPPSDFAAQARVSREQYEAEYKASRADNEAYWGEQGKCLNWIKPYTKVKNVSWQLPNLSIAWYEDGTLNLAENCIDRHAETHPERHGTDLGA